MSCHVIIFRFISDSFGESCRGNVQAVVRLPHADCRRLAAAAQEPSQDEVDLGPADEVGSCLLTDCLFLLSFS